MGFAITAGSRLLASGAIDHDVLEAALARQSDTGGRLGTILYDMGVVSRFTLVNLLNLHHGQSLMRVADELYVNANAAAVFPRQLAERHQLVPMNRRSDSFVVGAMDPPSPQVIHDIEAAMLRPVQVRLIPEVLFQQIRRDLLKQPTDFFDTHVDPSQIVERPFQEGHMQGIPRDLILFEVAGISLAFKRRKKGSTVTRLGDMLIEDGLLTQQELEDARAKHPDKHLGEALVEADLIDTRLLSLYLSRHFECATIDPYFPFTVEPDILRLIHPGTARKFQIVPLAIYEGNLLLLTPEPDNATITQVASRESGYAIKPVVSPLFNAKWLVQNFYPMPKPKAPA
jgi:hypothetical protein